MAQNEIIGSEVLVDSCIICYQEHFLPSSLSRINMDLLLSRKSVEEILHDYNQDLNPLKNEIVAGHLALHAEHCSLSMVPDDYILNPDRYEPGEKWRFNELQCAQEEEYARAKAVRKSGRL